MLADEQSTRRECEWAHGRSSSALHGTPLTEAHTLEDCLTATETEYLRIYRGRYPRFAYVMNNNPAKMPVHSGSHRFLGTITKRCFIVWPGMCNRGFTPEELFLFQGYPMFPPARAGEQLSWDVVQPRSRHGITEQAGNAMHVHVIGLALIYACCFCHSTTPSSGLMQRAAALKRRLSCQQSDEDADASSPAHQAPASSRQRA